MKKTSTKKRIFEVMSRLDKTFKINENNQDIDSNYTHFAVLKSNNKIINGWNYSDYNSDELKSFKNNYFFNDINNMDIDPKLVAIYTKKSLEKKGINPFDLNNWQNLVKENAYNPIDHVNVQPPLNLKEEIMSLTDYQLDVDDILNGYLEIAMLVQSDEDLEWLNEKSINDFDENSVANAKIDIYNFLKRVKSEAPQELEDFFDGGFDAKQMGIYLWLSRNGEGSGFFDYWWNDLQKIAKNMGNINLYLGKDGKIYIR